MYLVLHTSTRSENVKNRKTKEPLQVYRRPVYKILKKVTFSLVVLHMFSRLKPTLLRVSRLKGCAAAINADFKVDRCSQASVYIQKVVGFCYGFDDPLSQVWGQGNECNFVIIDSQVL